jgi:hypothetical protein
MIDQWYFAWDDHRFGPFSAAQLKELAALGRLQPTDTVWKAGVEKGVPADKVKHLFPTRVAEAHPAEASSLLTQRLSSTLERPHDLCSPKPNGAAKLDPWLNAHHDQTVAEERVHDLIPNGLMLEGQPGPHDAPDWSPHAPSNSPVPDVVAGGEPEASPALTVTAEPKADGPATPGQDQPSSPKKLVKKGRATAVKGAILISQDGEVVQYRKKCLKCGYENTTRSSMPIRNVVSTASFFCPKCRKSGAVVIRGVI